MSDEYTENGFAVPDPNLEKILTQCYSISDETEAIEAGLLTKGNRSCHYFSSNLERIKEAVKALVTLLGIH